MLTTFFRSSSLNTLDDFCEQKFFLTYVLGGNEDTNIKTEYGSCCHAVFEVLGIAKKQFQDDPKLEEVVVDHQTTGPVVINKKTWMIPHTLTKEEADAINTTRINKSVYKWEGCKVKEGDIWYGVDLVNSIISLCYAYYSNKSKHEWKKIDRKTVDNFTWILLSYNNGSHDPRKQDIVQTEHPFEFQIEKPWAKYRYDLPDGRTVEGNLAIKGTVDLVTMKDGILYALDYKTGARFNWGTNKVKDMTELKKDKQLMLYYYALRRLYPEHKKIMLTIFFVRDGGPFDLEFDDNTIETMEEYLRLQFEYTKSVKVPKMCDPTQQDKKCKSFCSYYKRELDGTNYCKAIHEQIKSRGINHVLSDHMDISKFGYYQSPGA